MPPFSRNVRQSLAFATLAFLSGVHSARATTGAFAEQAAPTQQTSPQPEPAQAAPPPKGKVLFERHEPVTDGAVPSAPETEASPEANPTGKPGVSSSTKRERTTLHRRGTASEAAEGNTPAATPPGAPGQTPMEAFPSSAADEAAPKPVAISEQDRDAAGRITVEERSAPRIDAVNLDLHLNSHTGQAEARAQLTVRNTASTPEGRILLRVSGALQWESARIAGTTAALPIEQHRIPDDLDHTGIATEISVPLARPLASGASVALDLYYGGTLSASEQRLTAIGAPASRAAETDWDTVTDTFTALRGMGQVLWYPVTGTPEFLRDGSALPDAVEASRMQNANSSFRLRLTVEYEGSVPRVAFFCGEPKSLQPLASDATQSAESGAVVAEWTRSQLGPHTPSLFISAHAPSTTGSVRVASGDASSADTIEAAAARVQPMLSEWLGAAPERPLSVLDLPVTGAAAFADGPLLVLPLSTAGDSAALTASLVQPMTNAWLPDGIAAPWLRDGLPAFMQAVWLERTKGRSTALASLASRSEALRERSGSVDYSSSQEQVAPLATCTDPDCTRGRAAYVFEMLRSMLGDAALQQAISGWRVQGEGPRRSAAEETQGLEQMLQRAAGPKDLQWFFRSWIDGGHSLPDLAIVTVAPRRVERSAPPNYLPQARQPVAGPIGAEPVPQQDDRHAGEQATTSSSGAIAPAPGSWLVAVEVQNNGGTDVEVPVTVRNGSLTNTLLLRVAAGSRATIRVPFEAQPEEVIVNDGSVPEAHSNQHRRTLRDLPR